MSLEAAINENTQVLRELLARLQTGALPTPAAASVAEVKKSEAAASVATQATAAASGAQETKAEPSAKPLGYDDVKEPFLALVKSKGREKGLAVLATFGVANLKEVPAAKFGEALTAINAAAA